MKVVGVAALAALVLAGASASAAERAFPGGNGVIVYVSDWAPNLKNAGLYAVRADGGAARLIGDLDPAADWDPAYAPDGRRLAFARFGESGWDLFVRDAAGGLTQLTTVPATDREPAWSPDGQGIAFASDRRGNSEIWVADADGSNPVRLTTNTAPPFSVSFPRPGDRAPAWSPDGRWIAFARNTGTESGVYVVAADGSGERRVTTGSVFAPDSSPAWSPDGSTIAFASPHVSVDASEIELVGADGTRRRVLAGSDLGTNPAWSPDGRTIAFVRIGGQLATLPSGGGSVRILNREAVLSRPVWSRDGRELVFASGVSFGPFRLHRLGPTGARLAPLPGLAGTSFLAWPGWSPDGGRLAYLDDYRLVVANADGRGRRVLTSGAAVQDPAWSPDGSWIAIRRAGDLFLIAADGSRLHPITRTPHVEEEPAWSPDGRWIVHVRRDRTRSVDRELWRVRPDGTGLRRLTDNGFEDTSPAWSPDGRRIAFTRGRTEGSFGPETWVMNADGSGERRVVAAVSPDGQERWSDERPSWSPDGRWILYESRADIWIVRPDGTGAIDLTPDARSQDRDPAWQPRCARSGNAGPNRLVGGRGADFLCGGPGSDRLVGGAGPDRLFGEQGDDVIAARDGAFDIVGCGAGRDSVTADRADLVGVDCERISRR